VTGVTEAAEALAVEQLIGGLTVKDRWGFAADEGRILREALVRKRQTSVRAYHSFVGAQDIKASIVSFVLLGGNGFVSCPKAVLTLSSRIRHRSVQREKAYIELVDVPQMR